MAYLNGKKISFSPRVTIDGYDSGYSDGQKDILAICMDGATSLASAFSGFSITSFPSMDLSDYTSFPSTFSNCAALTTVGNLNTENGTSFIGMFSGCSSLVAVEGINLSSCGSNISCTNIFSNCSSLNTLNINGIIKTSLNVSPAALTNNSYKSILTALSPEKITNATLTLATAAETIITGDSELNTLYNTALTNGWTISFA